MVRGDPVCRKEDCSQYDPGLVLRKTMVGEMLQNSQSLYSFTSCYCYSRIYLFTFNNQIYIQGIYLFTFTGVFPIHRLRAVSLFS